MHRWRDDSFDWKMLDDGIEMISSFMRFWGRIGVNSKEKYGTARIYVTFWDGSLHGLIYPSAHFSQFPGWLWSLDCKYIGRFIRWTKLNRVINWYQSKIYSLAYSKAIALFPKIKVELVISADAPGLIKEHEAIMTMYRFRRFIEDLLEL